MEREKQHLGQKQDGIPENRDMGIQRDNGDYPAMPYMDLIDGRMSTIERQVQEQDRGLHR